MGSLVRRARRHCLRLGSHITLHAHLGRSTVPRAWQRPRANDLACTHRAPLPGLPVNKAGAEADLHAAQSAERPRVQDLCAPNALQRTRRPQAPAGKRAPSPCCQATSAGRGTDRLPGRTGCSSMCPGQVARRLRLCHGQSVRRLQQPNECPTRGERDSGALGSGCPRMPWRLLTCAW